MKTGVTGTNLHQLRERLGSSTSDTQPRKNMTAIRKVYVSSDRFSMTNVIKGKVKEVNK